MTEPMPLDDRELGVLLGRHPAPPLGAGFADRVVAEARRPERARVLPIAPPPRRPVRRWTRRGIWSGIIAVNLIVASAIAAAVGGGAIHLSHVVEAVAQALHVRHHMATPHPVAVAHHAPVRSLVAAPAVAPAPPAVMAAPVAMPVRAPIEPPRPAMTAMRAPRPLPMRVAPIRHDDHALAGHRRELVARHPKRPGRPEPIFKAAVPERRLPAERDRPLRDEGTARANLTAREAMTASVAQSGAIADRGSVADPRAEQLPGQTPRAHGARAQGWRPQAWRQREQAWQQRDRGWQQRQQGGQQTPGTRGTGQGGDRIATPHPNNPRPGGWKKNKPAAGKGLRRGWGRGWGRRRL